MVNNGTNDHLLPPIKISSNTLKHENSIRDRSPLQLTRIVSETSKLGMRWFVMGDNDTLFFPDNLIRVLSRDEHDQYYYTGSSTSENHKQNIVFNHKAEYSYPLAKALAKMQDRCIERYPCLHG
jgi:hypothetical protein